MDPELPRNLARVPEIQGEGMIARRKFLALAAALALLAPHALPQEDARSRIRTTVNLVVVPVTAKDRRGQLVSDIRREEFRVFEDGVEQQIALFSVDSFPLSAVVLIDNALVLQVAAEVERGAVAIASGFSESDDVAIALFDEVSWPVLDFTADNDKLYAQLKRLRLSNRFPGQGSAVMTTGPRVNATSVEPKVPVSPPRAARGTKNLDDAVFAAGQMLRSRGRDRRKIILLVSDGSNSRNNSVTFDDAIKALLSADIAVYAIGVGNAVLNRPGNALAKYARATGGDVFYASKRAELESLYARVTEQARNQYTLAYVAQKTDRSREYHSIEVRVRRPDLTLLARDGYYAMATP